MSSVHSLADPDLEKLATEAGGAPPNRTELKPAAMTGPWAKWLKRLGDGGVEIEGMERIPEDRRLKDSGWKQLLFWFSVNQAFGALTTGWLAAEYFFLDFRTTMAIVWGVSVFGCATQAWVATLGPKHGLRTMALSRFAGGWPGTFIFSVLNIATQLAYSVTTALAGAQALHAINHRVSLVVGLVVVSVIVLVIAAYAYFIIHYVECYAWIVMFSVYCLMYGLPNQGDPDVNRLTDEMDVGRAKAADLLSFVGITFSVSSGWCTIAADYNTRLDPGLVPAWRTFAMTWLGTYLPICFTMTLSACFQILTKQEYIDALQDDGIGGSAGVILSPLAGFGKFVLVILAFSTIAANVPNTYSGSLAAQALHPVLMKVPRVFFVLLFTVAYLVAAIAGRQSFGDIMADFASILAYYTAIFVMFLEHVWFRRTNGPLGPLNPDDFNTWSKLPPGYACVATILCCVGLIVPCMAETWYTGPLALAVSRPYGGDLGFEVALFGGLVFYGAFRTAEVAWFGR